MINYLDFEGLVEMIGTCKVLTPIVILSFYEKFQLELGKLVIPFENNSLGWLQKS